MPLPVSVGLPSLPGGPGLNRPQMHWVGQWWRSEPQDERMAGRAGPWGCPQHHPLSYSDGTSRDTPRYATRPGARELSVVRSVRLPLQEQSGAGPLHQQMSVGC
jgi:hypothetical protein